MKLSPESLARAQQPPTRGGRSGDLGGDLRSAANGSDPGHDPRSTRSPPTSISRTNPGMKRAQQLLEDRGLEEDFVTPQSIVMVGPAAGAAQDPAFAAQVNGVLEELRTLRRPTSCLRRSPPASPCPQRRPATRASPRLGPIESDDGTAVLFTVIMSGDSDLTGPVADELESIREDATVDGTDQTYMLGEVTSTEDFKRISRGGQPPRGEMVGVIAAIIVLLVVFGLLIAGVTPIVMAIFAIAVALGIVAVMGTVWRFTFFVPHLISMMGLAVGIDYSLFIVSRYREERRKGGDKLRSIGRLGATANRAVFFSGLTVVIALSGMLLVPTTIFRGLAGGAIIVVLVSVAASMTLLPRS